MREDRDILSILNCWKEDSGGGVGSLGIISLIFFIEFISPDDSFDVGEDFLNFSKVIDMIFIEPDDIFWM